MQVSGFVILDYMYDIDPFTKGPALDMGDTSLSGKYRLDWIEDSFTPRSIAQSDEIMNSGTSHIGTSFNTRKMFAFLIAATILLMGIIGRLVYIQILEGNAFHVRAEENRERIVPTPSERGLIFDRNGIQLTENIPNFSLAVIPQDVPKDAAALQAIISLLSKITGEEQSNIEETLQKYKNYRRDSIIITEDIPYETALKVLARASELPGIYVQRGSKRLYLPEGPRSLSTSTSHSLSHVLGYIGKLSPEELEEYYDKGYLPSDSIGKTGVESGYESFVRGKYGRKRIEVNAGGVEQSVLAEEDPIPGSHIKLAIDARMEEELEKILTRHLVKLKKERASAVVMNPQNGEILALISIPGFDNNDFSGGIDRIKYKMYIEDANHPLFNRAIGGSYPSGSVIKPAMAAAALFEGVITSETTVQSTGGLQIGTWFFPDWGRVAHGTTNVRKSIAWSINTFYYYIGGGYKDFIGLGVERIVKNLTKFGFGEKLGIDIPGEYAGFLPTPEWKKRTKGEVWFVGDTYNFSIGQGDFLTSPLQIASMTATVANKGTVYRPHTVKAIIDPITKSEQQVEPEKVRTNIMSASDLEIVRLGMKDCVLYGSCRRLAQLPFDAAGKTGTAQWNQNKDTHAWFTSFAPYENPQIVVTIMIEEGGEGGIVAQPVAYEFYAWWWNYINSKS